MTIVKGITEKAGKVIGGQLHGNDVVLFRLRIGSRRDLLEASLKTIEEAEFIANALATVREIGLSFVAGARALDKVQEDLERELNNSHDSKNYKATPCVLKNGTPGQPCTLYEYDGVDPAKEGRLYLRGEVLEQEVLIPAQLPKPDNTPAKYQAENAIRALLPIGNYGQFMLRSKEMTRFLMEE